MHHDRLADRSLSTPSIVAVRRARSSISNCRMKSSNRPAASFPSRSKAGISARLLGPILRSRGTDVHRPTSFLASRICSLVFSITACNQQAMEKGRLTSFNNDGIKSQELGHKTTTPQVGHAAGSMIRNKADMPPKSTRVAFRPLLYLCMLHVCLQ